MSARDFDEFDAEEMDDYVPAVFARSLDEAEQFCQLLEDHDIPAVIDEEYHPPRKGGSPVKGGVAVLVPESLLEDARGFLSETQDLGGLSADKDDDEADQDDDEEEEEFDDEQEEYEEEEDLGVELEQEKDEDEDDDEDDDEGDDGRP